MLKSVPNFNILKSKAIKSKSEQHSKFKVLSTVLMNTFCGYSIKLLFLFSIFTNSANAQCASWVFPHMQMKMNINGINTITPIGAGSIPASINNYNAMQDVNGNLLFYIVDQTVFDAAGNPVGNMENNASTAFGNIPAPYCMGFPETCIIQANEYPDCDNYFVISAGINNTIGGPGDGITPQWFTYNSSSNTLSGVNSTYLGNVITVNGSPNEWLQLNQHFKDMHFAVTKRNCGTGIRKLYIFNGNKLYHADINSNSISDAEEIPSTVFGNLSGNNSAEMEAITADDGTIYLAFYSQGEFYKYLNIYHFQADGETIISEVHNQNVFTGANQPTGLEFCKSGRYLYYTSKVVAPYIFYYDLTTNLANPVPATAINTANYKNSQIEMGIDGRLYIISNSPGNLQLSSFLTPESPLSNSWISNAATGINFTFPFGYDNVGILPDQIDGENYFTQGIVNSAITITQTPDIPLCADAYNTATLTATAECPPLSYLWSNGATTSAINVNAPGYYTVTLTYQCGITSTASIQVYHCCEGTYRVDGIKTLSSLTNCPFLTLNGQNAFMTNIYDCNNPTDPHPTIAVNGRLIIDKFFTVNGMEFIMGPNSEIEVLNGCYIRNGSPPNGPFCDYFHGCGEYMWRGIYLNGSVANNYALQFTTTNVYIEDAKNGIWSKNNSKLIVENVIFNKNNNGILFTPPLLGSSNNTSQITNCKFMCNDLNTLALQTCIRPYLGLRGNTGVKSSDIDFLQIGNATNLNARNNFRNLDTGIAVIYGEVKIVNNQFSDMPLIDPNDQGLENGIGIAAYGFKLNPAKVTIGISGFGENIFERLEYGIHTRNMVENNITYNKFYNTEFGIYMASHNKSAITIQSNEFFDFTSGIFGLNMTNTSNNCLVDGNLFNFNTGLGRTAVRLGANNGLKFYASVNNNYIANCRTGINILNATEAYTYENYIVFKTAPSPIMLEHVGIRGQNCYYIESKLNNITWPMHPPQNDMHLYASKVKGFLLNTCNSGAIHKNVTDWCGRGFETIFNCPALEYTCNENYNSYNGFYLTGATLPNMVKQLSNDVSNVNTWFGNIGLFNIDGNCTPFEWYYDPTIPNSNPNPFNISLVIPTIEQNNIVDCSIVQEDELTNTLERIINDSIVYDSFYEENRYAEDEFAYSTLNSDSLLAANFNSLLKMQFCNALDEDAIGRFYKIEQLINEENYTNAYVENNKIVDQRSVAINKQMVNDIYLRTLAIGNKISPADKATLMEIATTLSLTGGDGVFWARSILGIDFEDLLSNYLRNTQTAVSTNAKNTQVRIAPNPTNGKAILNSNKPINYITLYNSLQQELKIQPTLMDNNTVEIDLTLLTKGAYYVKVVFEDDVQYYTVILSK